MKRSDYKCEVCSHIETIIVGYGEDFKPSVTCDRCGSQSNRSWSSPTMIVKKGEMGNAQTNYTTKKRSV